MKSQSNAELAKRIRRKHLPWDEYPEFSKPGSVADQIEADIAAVLDAKDAEYGEYLVQVHEANVDLIAREAQASHERNELRAKLAERQAALKLCRDALHHFATMHKVADMFDLSDSEVAPSHREAFRKAHEALEASR